MFPLQDHRYSEFFSKYYEAYKKEDNHVRFNDSRRNCNAEFNKIGGSSKYKNISEIKLDPLQAKIFLLVTCYGKMTPYTIAEKLKTQLFQLEIFRPET